MTIVVLVSGLLLASGALAAAVRLIRGPGPIDRAAAMDVLVAIVVGAIVLAAAASSSSVALTIAVVVSLLGFVGSAGLAILLRRSRG